MYASLGAETIAKEIKAETGVSRSVGSIQVHAHRIGVSLVKYQTCPRCGRRQVKLNRITGLCDMCNAYERRDQAKRENADLRALKRELEEDVKQTVEYKRVWREYRATSRSNERLAEQLGLPPKSSRGTHWERNIL